MILRALTQLHFRNLETPRLEFGGGVTVVVGPNGAGKSNLLDACYLALTGYLPSGRIADSVRIGQEEGFVGARLEHDEGVSTIEVGLAPGRKALRLDGQPARTSDLARVSAAVLVTPRDADLVHGSPSGRRGYLDSLLGRLSARYAHQSREYQRVLEQRNALLRAGAWDAGLEVWTDRLAELGDAIEALRRRAMVRIAGLAGAAYCEIAGGGASFAVSLLNRDAPPLAEALAASRAEERARGVTVVGPHRDDLVLELEGRSLQAYGSRGEARTAALALRIAEYRLLEEKHEEPPVLLLDDFTAELDGARRAYLLRLAGRAQQALVTGTEAPQPLEDGEEALPGARLLAIEGGVVSGG